MAMPSFMKQPSARSGGGNNHPATFGNPFPVVTLKGGDPEQGTLSVEYKGEEYTVHMNEDAKERMKDVPRRKGQKWMGGDLNSIMTAVEKEHLPEDAQLRLEGAKFSTKENAIYIDYVHHSAKAMEGVITVESRPVFSNEENAEELKQAGIRQAIGSINVINEKATELDREKAAEIRDSLNAAYEHYKAELDNRGEDEGRPKMARPALMLRTVVETDDGPEVVGSTPMLHTPFLHTPKSEREENPEQVEGFENYEPMNGDYFMEVMKYVMQGGAKDMVSKAGYDPEEDSYRIEAVEGKNLPVSTFDGAPVLGRNQRLGFGRMKLMADAPEPGYGNAMYAVKGSVDIAPKSKGDIVTCQAIKGGKRKGFPSPVGIDGNSSRTEDGVRFYAHPIHKLVKDANDNPCQVNENLFVQGNRQRQEGDQDHSEQGKGPDQAQEEKPQQESKEEDAFADLPDDDEDEDAPRA